MQVQNFQHVRMFYPEADGDESELSGVPVDVIERIERAEKVDVLLGGNGQLTRQNLAVLIAISEPDPSKG